MTAAPGYVAVSRRALDLEDYIDIARRHSGWIVAPAFAGIVISIAIAFLLPNTYVSTAQMQITPAQISPMIVQSTINQQLTERILQMQTEIESRTSLSNIIQDPRLDLYKDDRESRPLEDVIEEMRRDIQISITSVPSISGSARASAFSISFSYPNRIKAQQTVQMLITKFQDANQNAQRTQQTVVTTFVRDELAQAKANLDQIEEKLTRFRQENAGRLPEQTSLNIAQLSSLQQQLAAANDGLNRNDQERVQLESRQKTLESQMQLLNAFEKDSEAAGNAIGPAARQNERLLLLNRTITDMESQLAQLHQMFKPTYPDIKSAEARLAVIRAERDQLLKQQQEADDAQTAQAEKAAAKKPTNYQSAQAINQLQGQIDAARVAQQTLAMQRTNLLKQQENANRAISEYQQRLSATTGLEAKEADLLRAEKDATEKYQSFLNKQQLADQNDQLLQRKAGEQLEVLDPPSLPTKPAKPNRGMIIGGGAFVSLLVGLVFAGAHEARDASLKNLKDVRAYTNLPVLSSIPLLENTVLVRRKKRLAYLAWSAGVILGVIAVASSLFYYYQYTNLK